MVRFSEASGLVLGDEGGEAGTEAPWEEEEVKLEDLPDGAVIADGLDDAIIGITTRGIVVYSFDKCIEILMNRDDMGPDEAIEYFYFNIECAYVGEKTPIFIEQ